jgi:hypothetical protein
MRRRAADVRRLRGHHSLRPFDGRRREMKGSEIGYCLLGRCFCIIMKHIKRSK